MKDTSEDQGKTPLNNNLYDWRNALGYFAAEEAGLEILLLRLLRNFGLTIPPENLEEIAEVLVGTAAANLALRLRPENIEDFIDRIVEFIGENYGEDQAKFFKSDIDRVIEKQKTHSTEEKDNRRPHRRGHIEPITEPPAMALDEVRITMEKGYYDDLSSHGNGHKKAVWSILKAPPSTGKSTAAIPAINKIFQDRQALINGSREPLGWHSGKEVNLDNPLEQLALQDAPMAGYIAYYGPTRDQKEEFAAKVRELCPDIPVIVIHGKDGDDNRGGGDKSGPLCVSELRKAANEKGVPFRTTLCPTCPHLKGCEYHKQFEDIALGWEAPFGDGVDDGTLWSAAKASYGVLVMSHEHINQSPFPGLSDRIIGRIIDEDITKLMLAPGPAVSIKGLKRGLSEFVDPYAWSIMAVFSAIIDHHQAGGHPRTLDFTDHVVTDKEGVDHHVIWPVEEEDGTSRDVKVGKLTTKILHEMARYLRQAGEIDAEGLAERYADVRRRVEDNAVGVTRPVGAPGRPPSKAAWANYERKRREALADYFKDVESGKKSALEAAVKAAQVEALQRSIENLPNFRRQAQMLRVAGDEFHLENRPQLQCLATGRATSNGKSDGLMIRHKVDLKIKKDCPTIFVDGTASTPLMKLLFPDIKVREFTVARNLKYTMVTGLETTMMALYRDKRGNFSQKQFDATVRHLEMIIEGPIADIGGSWVVYTYKELVETLPSQWRDQYPHVTWRWYGADRGKNTFAEKTGVLLFGRPGITPRDIRDQAAALTQAGSQWAEVYYGDQGVESEGQIPDEEKWPREYENHMVKEGMLSEETLTWKPADEIEALFYDLRVPGELEQMGDRNRSIGSPTLKHLIQVGNIPMRGVPLSEVVVWNGWIGKGQGRVRARHGGRLEKFLVEYLSPTSRVWVVDYAEMAELGTWGSSASAKRELSRMIKGDREELRHWKRGTLPATIGHIWKLRDGKRVQGSKRKVVIWGYAWNEEGSGTMGRHLRSFIEDEIREKVGSDFVFTPEEVGGVKVEKKAPRDES